MIKSPILTEILPCMGALRSWKRLLHVWVTPADYIKRSHDLNTLFFIEIFQFKTSSQLNIKKEKKSTHIHINSND